MRKSATFSAIGMLLLTWLASPARSEESNAPAGDAQASPETPEREPISQISGSAPTEQANAFYGLALAQELRGDLELAMGAMRSYLHLARSESETHLRRARAALWEWETQLETRREAARP